MYRAGFRLYQRRMPQQPLELLKYYQEFPTGFCSDSFRAPSSDCHLLLLLRLPLRHRVHKTQYFV